METETKGDCGFSVQSSEDEDDLLCVQALGNYESEHPNNIDLTTELISSRSSSSINQLKEETELEKSVKQQETSVETSDVRSFEDQGAPEKSNSLNIPQHLPEQNRSLEDVEENSMEKTDDESCNNTISFIPKTPRKVNVKTFFRTKRKNDRLKNHAIYHLNSPSLSPTKTINMEKSTNSCLQNAFDQNTDSNSSEESGKIVMAFNMRDFILMTSDSSLEAFPDSPEDHTKNSVPSKPINVSEQSSSNKMRKEKVIYDPPIVAKKKISRNRSSLNDSEAEFIKADSEPETSSCSSNDGDNNSNPSAKGNNINIKPDQKNNNKAELSESKSSDGSDEESLRSPFKRKRVKALGKKAKPSDSDSDGSPQSKKTKPSDSDGSPLSKKTKPSDSDGSPQSKKPKPLRYMTRLKASIYKKNGSVTSGNSENGTVGNPDSTEEDNTSSGDDNKRYTRSRPVKPGRKFRYRKVHTGKTDVESAKESDSDPTGNIEFETDADSSNTEVESSCSPAASSDVPDPEEEEEENYEEECIVCRTLGDLSVTDRSKYNQAYWCKCGHCTIVSPMMRDYDRICCREMLKVVDFMEEEVEGATKEDMCVTKHPRFRGDVLGFAAFLRTQKNTFFHPETAKDGQKVHHACRSYLRWIFDRLGEGNRIMLPACVHQKIRETHMRDNQNSYFKCFRPVKMCIKGLHCRAAM